MNTFLKISLRITNLTLTPNSIKYKGHMNLNTFE